MEILHKNKGRVLGRLVRVRNGKLRTVRVVRDDAPLSATELVDMMTTQVRKLHEKRREAILKSVQLSVAAPRQWVWAGPEEGHVVFTDGKGNTNEVPYKEGRISLESLGLRRS